LLLVDEACNEPIKLGLNLSRSTIQYFKHNDMADLEAILQSIADDDIRLKRDVSQQRRFIVVEGIYRNTGDICFLPNIMVLKEQFRYRLILDESLSFGTMGATGKGITEHFGINVADVEILTVAMDTALGSVGGLCIGTREVVDHQRLSGAGYCFSASAPPFLSAAACESLAQLRNNPEILCMLRKNSEALHKGLSGIKGMKLLSNDVTPVMHLVLDPALPTWEAEAAMVVQIANNCIHRGVGVTSSKFSLTDRESSSSRPSIRICASSTLKPKEITHAIAEIKKEITLALTRSRKSLRLSM
jgi:serine palmitoyltransferase